MELLNDFLSWVWARHHNELSWYVRPLFLLPFCFFAYRRSLPGILVNPLALIWADRSVVWFAYRSGPRSFAPDRAGNPDEEHRGPREH